MSSMAAVNHFTGTVKVECFWNECSWSIFVSINFLHSHQLAISKPWVSIGMTCMGLYAPWRVERGTRNVKNPNSGADRQHRFSKVA